MSETIERLESVSRALRRNIITMIGPDNRGHFGGSCSAADLVAALYFHIMRIDPANPQWPERDRFIFSKGHSALAQYAALGELGFFPREEFASLKTLGGLLQGHPETTIPGVEANTGSLGQGLSVACGIAAGLKIDGKKNRVFCIMGDGEQAEGQIWEAAMTAVHYRLDNVIAFIDKNDIQATGFVRDRYNTDPLARKWDAFGWHVQDIDGHDLAAIIRAVETASSVKGRPKVIISRTIKGKGIPCAENTAAFHNGAMTQEQYDKTLEILA